MADLLKSPTNLRSPPFCNISGIANFRDIGGYACSQSSNPSAHSIRQGLVFRSADPSRVQPDGLDKLKELGVKKAFDLRSVPEIQRKGPEWAGVEVDAGAFVTKEDGDTSEAEHADNGKIERIWCPVFREEDYGPEKVALRYKAYASSGSDGFVQAYKDILANGPTAYRTVLKHMAQPSPEPCLVHCTAGKDRTGVLVALLYLLCGVDAETIAEEYSLTDEGLRHLRPLFTERLLNNPALAGNEAGVQNMISSKPENMRATIKMIEQVYGSAEKYLTEVVGLKEHELNQLRTNLTTDRMPLLS